MAYTLSISIALGARNAGLSDLRAQLVDTAGADVGSVVVAGFVELGSGNYLWTGTIPASHRGGIKFWSNVDGETILAGASINPQETENADVLASSRATPAQVSAAVGTPLQAADYTAPPAAASIAAAVWAASGRTLSSWGTLAADVATAVWSAGTRSLTTFGTLVADLRAGISADHGAGAYGPGDAGGAYTATVTVLDDGTDTPLPEVRVTVRTDAGVLKAQARTDDAGELAVPLDDGDYLVSASGLPGYSGTADQPLSVDGAAATLTLRLSPIPSAAAAPGTRVVRVITVDPSGAELAGVPVTAHLAARGRVSVDQALVVLQTLSVTSGADGVADLVLITEDQFEEGDGVYVIRCGDVEVKTGIPAGSGVLNLQEHLQG